MDSSKQRGNYCPPMKDEVLLNRASFFKVFFKHSFILAAYIEQYHLTKNTNYQGQHYY